MEYRNIIPEDALYAGDQISGEGGGWRGSAGLRKTPGRSGRAGRKGFSSPRRRRRQPEKAVVFPVNLLFPPAVCILSTFPIEEGEYGTISGTSMASPHAASALALLASRNNPNSAADVYNLYDQLKNAGNYDWTDDSGDGIQEPLLDVSDSTVFAPTLVATDGGSTDSPPSVSITNPAEGATVSVSVSVSADAADDNGVSQVEFFVDGGSIGIDSDGSDGWSAGWDTTAYTDGSHTMEAVATDSAGQTASDSISVTVDNSGGSTDPIDLSVSAYKVRGTQYADLTWSGAASTYVDIYRDGSAAATTENDGFYTDTIGQKGGGSAIYQVCEAGTTTCSNEVTATW